MQYAQWLNEAGESFIAEMLKAAQNPDMISFAGGLPALELFPVAELQEAFNTVFAGQGPAALQYSETAGYLPLREWIARRYKRAGRNVRGEEVTITSGSQQGLSLIAQTFLDPGDVVLLETPTYLGALQAFQGFRADMRMVPSDSEGIVPAELENWLKTTRPKFLYVVPNYQNPTGKVMGLERRRQLVRLAEEYGLIIVEDNPYGELRYEGEGLPNLLEMSDKVIYLGTFSKVLAPGLRLGYMIADEDITRHLQVTKEGVDLHSNNLTQRAVYEFLSKNLLPDHILKLREVYGSRRQAMLHSLEHWLGEEVEMVVPTGGLFLWAKFKHVANSFEYLEATMRQNVLYVPGALFYPDGRVSSEMRLNFSCSTPDVIEEGVRRLSMAVRTAGEE